jgi:hypothetical protein
MKSILIPHLTLPVACTTGTALLDPASWFRRGAPQQAAVPHSVIERLLDASTC